VGNAPVGLDATGESGFSYRAPPLLTAFYLTFSGITLYILWRYRGKIRSRAVAIGLLLFVIGQSFGFVNPDLEAFALSMSLGAIGALTVCFAVLKWEIIRPLAQRNAQVDALRTVSLSITSSIERDTVLDQIVTQTAHLLGADAVALLLVEEAALRVATTYHLPLQYAGCCPPEGSLTAQIVRTGQPILLESYQRGWRGEEDLPLARDTFGSVIGIPLVFTGNVIGVLLVIAARYGRVFEREDQHLLQLLGGQASVAIGHSRLFTEQDALTRQVDYARRQLETVLVSTESPVIALDRGLNLIFANPAARAVFTALEAAVSGTPIANRLPPEAFPKQPLAAVRAIRRSKAFSYEFPVGGRYFLCHAAALGGTRIEGFVAVLNDVTQLKELDRMKSEMVRMTSHDLKNPLQGASANLELLRADLYDTSDSEVRLSIDEIDKQLQRMHRIISGILDLERAKYGRLRLEWCTAAQVVTHAVDDLRRFAAERRITLETVLPVDLPPFPCDITQFNRAIINLVENAIKFTPPGGTVTIGVLAAEGDLIFSVRDTGVGMPPEVQARVFERFFRGKQKGMEHVSGTGLGLSLVKAIVEHHWGRVWLESVEGSGTTFYAAVPLKPLALLLVRQAEEIFV